YAITETYANLLASEKPPPSFAGQPPAKAPNVGPKLEHCERLSFNPRLELKPQTSPPAPAAATADSPTGLTVNLKVPPTNSAKTPATPQLKESRIKLPEGLTVSPSGADGLEACTNEQFGLGTEFEAQEYEPSARGHVRVVKLPPGVPPTEPPKPAKCPD